jgi:hypothetical protein
LLMQDYIKGHKIGRSGGGVPTTVLFTACKTTLI